MKECTRCKILKPLIAFSIRNDAPCGVASHCKECNRERRILRRDVISVQRKEYRDRNKELLSAQNAAKYAANPEKYKRKSADYAAKNREKIKAYFYARREDIARKAAEYRAANPAAVRAAKSARRSRILKSAGKFSARDVEFLFKAQKKKCAVCNDDISAKYHIDHVTPLSKGGGNDKANIQLLCPGCNLSKSAKDPVMFMQERGFLL